MKCYIDKSYSYDNIIFELWGKYILCGDKEWTDLYCRLDGPIIQLEYFIPLPLDKKRKYSPQTSC